MFSFLIAHETGGSKTPEDNEVTEFLPNKPSGLLGDAARAPAQEVSGEQKLLQS